MKFSLINKNNVIVAVIEANSYIEAKGNKNYDPSMILMPSEDHHKKGLDLNAYKPLSIKEQLDKGLITLAEDQVYDTASESIVSIAKDQEYKNGKIVNLTTLEQYQKGLLTEEEFNEKVNADRQIAYVDNTDTQVIELMRSYLNNNKDKLTKEEKALLTEINKKVKEIKKENPKA